MKNKHILSFKWAGMFTVLLLLLQIAQAGYYLPTSDIWQGARYYSTDDIYAYVEYAVYESSSLSSSSSVLSSISTSDNYVYVYQIFDIGTDDDLAIATFILSGGDTSVANDIGYQDDEEDGIVPDGYEINTTEGTFVWEFTSYLLVADEHSVYLVFTSDYAPTSGSFEMSTEYGDDIPVTGTSTDSVETTGISSIPEPTTVTLLSIGVLGLLKRRKSI